MLEAGRSRGEDPDDPYKRDPLDFVLWRRSLPGEPEWESLWVLARPIKK
jgi:L-cysteine:1D-myo-inositol 2-amino-2-deoxy-alpha-D-glucopyranoside ligase